MKKQTNKNGVTDKSDAEIVVEKAQDKAADLADQAKEQVANSAERAGQEARSAVSGQKHAAAGELHNIAEALRETESQLRQQDQDMFAEYSGRIAEQIDRASGYLEERNLEEIIEDAEDFARRQPELFLGGAFTLGLLAARFLKSSAPRYRDSDSYHVDPRLPAPDNTERFYTGRSSMSGRTLS